MSRKALAKFCAVLVVSAASLSGRRAWAQTEDKTAAVRDEVKFDVASIRPNQDQERGPGYGGLIPDGYRVVRTTTYGTLMVAYFPEGSLAGKGANIVNAPDWVATERYDIDARVAEKDLKEWGGQLGGSNEHVYLRAALRDLLKDRYRLRAHMVETQIPYVSIVLGQGQNQLVAVQDIPPLPQEGSWRFRKLPSGGYYAGSRDQDGNITWTFLGCTMGDLASAISLDFAEPAQDRTGLMGRYNFKFSFNAYEMEDELYSLRKLGKLGLDLRQDKGPAHNLVIEHIERPDAN